MYPFSTSYYKLGRSDAHANRYPLYAVLVIAGHTADAREYANGWAAITGCRLDRWVDPGTA